MTLAAYQEAFARLALSVSFCRRACAEGEAAFDGLPLTPEERARLAGLARQRGMQVTCVLSRANRLSPLVAALPRTCLLLRPELTALLDRYWEQQPMASLQALPAGLAFGRFVQDELAAGRVRTPGAAELLREELAALEVQLVAHTTDERAALLGAVE